MVYPLELYPAFFGYYFFNSMMGVLQALHIFWAYLILRMAHKFITGKVRVLCPLRGPGWPSTVECPLCPPASKLPSKLRGPGCGWNKPAQRPPLAGLWTSNNPASLFPQQVEDERSDREETESSEGEEPAAGGGAKSRPLANGHPILNNHHRKND